MDVIQALFLALIQGLTEFLPVSSSAHLILPSQLLGWPDQGLAFDVAVHAGTLVAVMVYYRESLSSLLMGVLGSGDNVSLRRREVSALLIATLPAVVIGIAFSDVIDQYLRGIGVIATTTLLFGVLLGVSYSYRATGADEQPISRLDHALAHWSGAGACAYTRHVTLWRDDYGVLVFRLQPRNSGTVFVSDVDSCYRGRATADVGQRV
jgi:undecaprenyl-diphosphatase